MSTILESGLDPERRADCEANDKRYAFGTGPSGAHYVSIPGSAAQWYHWPQVPWRTAERRQMPRASRFGD